MTTPRLKLPVIVLIVGLMTASGLFLPRPVQARTSPPDNKKLFTDANNLLSEEKYGMALPIFLDILESEPDNANIHYKAGICYLYGYTEKAKAVPHLRIANAHTSQTYKEDTYKETNAPEDATYHLAHAFHLTNQIDSAIFYFMKFNEIVSEDNTDLKKDIGRQLQMCEEAKVLMKKPQNITITSLGTLINTPFPEYAPVISADETTLIFTSRRDNSTGGNLTETGEYFEDIMISFKENGEWSRPLSIGSNINTDGHEATIGLSVDGQTLFIYKDDLGDGNIYISHLEGDVWTAPEKMGPTINS
ncbi:MAG: PD40 domain-containing protein, partial [Flavobacteriales bacterium]|nr:PD40 domain-containing protein [Flavobacteriales bacterium]